MHIGRFANEYEYAPTMHSLSRALRVRTPPAARALSAAGVAEASVTTATLNVPATHEVMNQVSPFEGRYSLFHSDDVLREAVQREAGDWALEHLESFGKACGTVHSAHLARSANRHKPRLHTHDRFGNRVDTVEFHPAYHDLMRMGVEAQVPSFAWNNASPQGSTSHAARAALPFMFNQLEPGVNCPLTMTYAAVPVLQKSVAGQAGSRSHGAWLAQLAQKLTQPTYDPADAPIDAKSGVTTGMSMTEKQGGSDVRANTTVAAPLDSSLSGPGEAYQLRGHKWFTSAPMSDAFLTLAYTEDSWRGERPSLSCFVVPRWLPDGGRNSGFRVMRLKDKMGDHSNASSEVEYDGAWGVMIGDEGKGVRTIIEMVQHTRLDCMIGSSSQMRMALAQAVHHCNGRSAFGTTLSTQPLMAGVLADLALHSEACTALTMRMAAAFDDEESGTLARIGTAVGKYWICKSAPKFVYEAMECHGGNGYVEDSVMPRLFRQSPLNAIWEGSGNVICLDVLRALGREPGAAEALLAEIQLAKGADARLDALVQQLVHTLRSSTPLQLERGARQIVEAMATALAASLLVRNSPTAVAGAFCATRLPQLPDEAAAGSGLTLSNHTSNFGTLPAEVDIDSIVERARPKM